MTKENFIAGKITQTRMGVVIETRSGDRVVLKDFLTSVAKQNPKRQLSNGYIVTSDLQDPPTVREELVRQYVGGEPRVRELLLRQSQTFCGTPEYLERISRVEKEVSGYAGKYLYLTVVEKE